MSLGFNKGVSYQLFPVLKLAFVFPIALAGTRRHDVSLSVPEAGRGGLRSQLRTCLGWTGVQPEGLGAPAPQADGETRRGPPPKGQEQVGKETEPSGPPGCGGICEHAGRRPRDNCCTLLTLDPCAWAGAVRAALSGGWIPTPGSEGGPRWPSAILWVLGGRPAPALREGQTRLLG